MDGGDGVDRRIVDHYESQIDEAGRLRDGAGWIEFARTRELVRRHLEGGPLRMLDIGGAAGIHAEWLAGDGHNVHIIDPMPRHVEQAREAAKGLDNPFTCALGDARSLDQPDASADAVLLFGPLYHLTDREDRLQAWSEARRVLRSGGWCFAAAVSRFASLFDGLVRGYLSDPRFEAIVGQDLASGQHRNPDDVSGWFTTAYFHHPDELEQEAHFAGFELEGLYGVEGMTAWLDDAHPFLNDSSHREKLLDAARATETDPSLRGLSPHMLLVARKP